MASHQRRLWFWAFADLMISVLRAEALRGTDLAAAALGQIRLKLFKIGARIKISCRRIHLELASAYPCQETLRRACANPLCNAGGLNFKDLLRTQESELVFSQRRTLLANSHRSGKKNPGSHSATLNRSVSPRKRPEVCLLHAITTLKISATPELKSSVSNAARWYTLD
jgi:hypothetical protein